MSITPYMPQATCISAERYDVRTHAVTRTMQDASMHAAIMHDDSNPDWETWIVQIKSWEEIAGETDADGVVWPTFEAIQSAIQVIRQMREREMAGPAKIVPSGDGGIVFKRQFGESREEIEVSVNGLRELLLFRDGRLAHRAALDR